MFFYGGSAAEGYLAWWVTGLVGNCAALRAFRPNPRGYGVCNPRFETLAMCSAPASPLHSRHWSMLGTRISVVGSRSSAAAVAASGVSSRLASSVSIRFG